MAFIESHPEIERHPKTLDLMAAMGWNLNETVGALHRFWWWCQTYADDGDLRKHETRLGHAIGLAGVNAEKFGNEMVRIGWIDKTPYLRVHDWWAYIGYYLRSKYRDHPEVWQRVKDLYANTTPTQHEGEADSARDTTRRGVKPRTFNQEPEPGSSDKKVLSSKSSLVEQIADVIAYLNAKTGRRYDPQRPASTHRISARLKEGFTVDDCKAVIDVKVLKWGKDDKMRQYLRPETLFAPSHFEDYLHEAKEKSGGQHGRAGTTSGQAPAGHAEGDREKTLRAATKIVDVP